MTYDQIKCSAIARTPICSSVNPEKIAVGTLKPLASIKQRGRLWKRMAKEQSFFQSQAFRQLSVLLRAMKHTRLLETPMVIPLQLWSLNRSPSRLQPCVSAVKS